MKAVPYAVVGAGVLAGWMSPVAARSPQSDSTQAASDRAACAAHASHDELVTTRLAHGAGDIAHVHGSSCPCSACRGEEPER